MLLQVYQKMQKLSLKRNQVEVVTLLKMVNNIVDIN